MFKDVIRGVAVAGAAVALSLALVTTAGCEQRTEGANAAAALEPQIARHAATQPSKQIDLAALTDFEWDRLFVFAPYSTKDEINTALGFEWPGATRTKISRSDSISLLLFVKGKDVVGWVEYPRVKADFSFVSTSTGYSKKDARFSIRDEKAWPVVALLRASTEP